MLHKTYVAFRDRLEYTKKKTGTWTAEFHGRIHVHAEDPSLDRCQDKALEELDGQLAAWITGPAAAIEGKRQRK